VGRTEIFADEQFGILFLRVPLVPTADTQIRVPMVAEEISAILHD